MARCQVGSESHRDFAFLPWRKWLRGLEPAVQHIPTEQIQPPAVAQQESKADVIHCILGTNAADQFVFPQALNASPRPATGIDEVGRNNLDAPQAISSFPPGIGRGAEDGLRPDIWEMLPFITTPGDATGVIMPCLQRRQFRDGI